MRRRQRWRQPCRGKRATRTPRGEIKGGTERGSAAYSEKLRRRSATRIQFELSRVGQRGCSVSSREFVSLETYTSRACLSPPRLPLSLLVSSNSNQKPHEGDPHRSEPRTLCTPLKVECPLQCRSKRQIACLNYAFDPVVSSYPRPPTSRFTPPPTSEEDHHGHG